MGGDPVLLTNVYFQIINYIRLFIYFYLYLYLNITILDKSLTSLIKSAWDEINKLSN